MSQLLFDGLSDISLEGTGLTVQQLLDSPLIQNAVTIDDQSVTSTNSTIEQLNSNCTSVSVIYDGINFDEDDLFQCGRCKLQFSSLEPFVIHKRNQCPTSKAKKYINEVTISASPSDTRDCGSPSSPSAINQVSSSTVSQNDLPQVEHQEEVDQNDKYDCTLTSALTSTVTDSHCQSVVVSEGDIFSLTLDNTQVFTLQEDLQDEKEIIKYEPSLYQTSTSTTVSKPSSTPISSMISEAQSPGISDSVVSSVVKSNEALFKGTTTGIQEVKLEFEEEDTTGLENPAKYPTSILPSPDPLSKGSVCTEPLKVRRKHNCMFCNKAFSKNFDLRQHIRSHTGEKPFQCIVCGRAFAQKSNVKKHMVTHKVWPKEAVCNTLPKEPIKKILSISSSGENGDENRSMKEKILFDNSYVCPFCSSTHSSYLDLRSHMKEHRDQKVYHCIQKDCNETFASLDDFITHTRSHDDKDVQYRCHTCSKLFPSLHALGFHHFEHSIYPWPKKSGPSYFRCTKCMNKYASAEALDHHLKMTKHHFPCKQCSKVFSSERLLRTHLRVHGNTNLFTCATCNKDLKSEHSLKVHQLIHTGERPFECHICKGAFNRKDKLKRHMLVHEPKKFKCPFSSALGCQREFSRKDKLRHHMLTHTHSNTRKQLSKKVEKRNRVTSSSLTSDAKMIEEGNVVKSNTSQKKATTTQVLKSEKDVTDELSSGLGDQEVSNSTNISLQSEKNKAHSYLGSLLATTNKSSSTTTTTNVSPNAAKIRVKKHRRLLSSKKEEDRIIQQPFSSKEPVSEKELETPASIPIVVEETLPSASTPLSISGHIIDKDLFKNNTGVTSDVTDPTDIVSILPNSEENVLEGEDIENEETFIASFTEEVVKDLTGENKLEVLYIPFTLTSQSDFLESKTTEVVDSVVATSPNSGSSIVESGSEGSFFVSTEEFESLENLSAEILLTEQDIRVVQSHNNITTPSSGCVNNVQSLRNNVFVVNSISNRKGERDDRNLRNNIFVIDGITEREEGNEEMEITLDGTRTIILQNKND